MSQIFRHNKPLPKYMTDRKLKMSAVFIFEIKGPKNGWPYGYDFWRAFRDLCEDSTKYNFAVFFKI